MPNRVIKDSIWTSPTLADLSDFAQDQFPRWLLMADDWGCFDANSKVIKGLCYPLRDRVTSARIDDIKKEYYNAGLFFLWIEGGHEWGYFVSWDSHHNFCNKTNVDDGGKNQKHRRKTPAPPPAELNQYLQQYTKSWNILGQIRTTKNEILNPNPNPNHLKSLSGNGKEIARPHIPFQEIIEDLNALSGRKFDYRIASTRSLIAARFREGRTLEDFKAVNRNKLGFLKDDQNSKYYRPETLYSAKHFESYLNEVPVDPEAWRYE